MSFASETKTELSSLEQEDCCLKAELAALIRMNGSISFTNKHVALDVMTENAAIARRIFRSIKSCFKVQSELVVRKKMRLKKNNVYIVRLPLHVKEILEDLHIISGSFVMKRDISGELVEDICCKRSYLRGAFLAGGSINNPDSASYHLEVFTHYEEHGQALVKLVNEFQLSPKLIERKKGYVMYVKEAEKITDFLNIIGAHRALFKFEDVRIVKDMRNSVNRLVNCETANLNKSVAAAMKQIENIRLIDQYIGLENLPEKLRDLALVRMQHPDINLTELGELLPEGKVSKSGINHRFRKIDEMAAKLR